MIKFAHWKNQIGATLLEAMIAVFILTIGILVAMTMQVRAIGSSSAALNRTDANNVAIALLETLKQLDFDDINLTATTTVVINVPPFAANPPPLGNPPVFDGNERIFNPALIPPTSQFRHMQSLVSLPAGAVGPPNGAVVDRSGITYQLSWDVQQRDLPGGGPAIEKVIRLYMTWNSLMGQNRLEMTTVKYRNITL